VEKYCERGRPHMTIWRMRVAFWTPKATNTHSQYVILITFPLHQRLHERAPMLRYTYIACIVRDISSSNGDDYDVFWDATPYVCVKVPRYVLFNDAVNF
jgi:hypothetical protein